MQSGRLTLTVEAIMAEAKTKKQEQQVVLPFVRAEGVKEALSDQDIADAISLHVEGGFTAYVHRYASDVMQQQIRLSTFHETKDGKKFRVMTEYHEALTIVDLVSLLDLMDESDLTTQ